MKLGGRRRWNRLLNRVRLGAALALMLDARYPPLWGQARSGAAFLKIPTGARAAAMGTAFTAVADDASAIFWNPAGAADCAQAQALFTHNSWISGMIHESANALMPLAHGTAGIGMIYLSQGTFSGRDERRNPTSDFPASDWAALFSFSQKAADFRLGANLKYIRQTIESEHAWGLAGDLGVKYPLPGSRFSLSAAALNLGNKIKFFDQADPPPSTLAMGAAYAIPSRLVLALDARRRVYDGNTNLALGAEFRPLKVLAVRAGYLSLFTQDFKELSNSQMGGWSGLSTGIGLRVSRYEVDYAFASYGALGESNRFSLLVRF